MPRVCFHCARCGVTDTKDLPGWTGPSRGSKCPRCYAGPGQGWNEVVDRAHEDELTRKRARESEQRAAKASEERLKRWEAEKRQLEEERRARGEVA